LLPSVSCLRRLVLPVLRTASPVIGQIRDLNLAAVKFQVRLQSPDQRSKYRLLNLPLWRRLTSTGVLLCHESDKRTAFGKFSITEQDLTPNMPLAEFKRLDSTGSGSSLNGAEDITKPFLIGVAGGTASGKTSVCEEIRKAVGNRHGNKETERQIITLSQDSFYRNLTNEESEQAKRGKFNFDHPDAFDHKLMLKCLSDIRSGKSTQVPVYDFKTNSRIEGQFDTILAADVVLLEGILVFYHKEVRDIFDMKLFVDTDADTRLARRVLRDIDERGRDLENVLFQYTNLVKPAFEEFCLPTKKFADVIIPRGADNKVAVNLVAQHIQDIIWRRNGTYSKSSSPTTRSRSNSDSLIR